MEESAQSSKSEVIKPKRRVWSAEERQRVVQASFKSGTRVDAVARLYGVNSSQIYAWRKQYRQELKEEKHSVLVPVQLTESAPETKQEHKAVIIEARSIRVTLNGSVEAAIISTVLECLVK
jgi:transposase